MVNVICRRVLLGILLVTLLGAGLPVHAQAGVYAVLGSEGLPILQALVGKDRVISVPPGTLTDTLKQQSVIGIVASVEWADQDDLAAMRSAGSKAIFLRRQTSLALILDNIREVGVFTGSQPLAQSWIETVQRRIAETRQAVARHLRQRVLVLTPEGYTVGQGALLTELIEIAGGINTAAEAAIPEARQLDDVQIVTFAPDVVLLLNWTPARVAELMRYAPFASVPAFTRHHLYRIDSLGRNPVRLVDDLQLLLDLIHPPLL